MLRVIFILLIYASLASAQPWQWEEYQGTFWHQTPADVPWSIVDSRKNQHSVSGDFNGNGRDEIITIKPSWIEFVEVAPSGNILDWETTQNSESFYDNSSTITFMQPIELDDDIQDELLVFTTLHEYRDSQRVQVFDPDDQVPPNFTERPDLLEALDYPAFPAISMLGDLDGDGLLEGLTLFGNRLQYLRYVDGNWDYWGTYDTGTTQYSLFFVADLNSDGDVEFGAYAPRSDYDELFALFVDSDNGAPVFYSSVEDVPFYSGDFDGDGNTESFMEGFDLFLPSQLVRLSAGEPFTATLLANQLVANSPVVYSTNLSGENSLFGFFSSKILRYGTLVPVVYLLHWSEDAWEIAGDIWGWQQGSIFEGNTAVMNGHGDQEFIYRMLVRDGISHEHMIWRSSISSYWDRFYDNQDTIFTNPRIGDVEADGAGELVTLVTSGAPVGLYFYEFNSHNSQFDYKPQLSAGLPTNITEFTLADIDNDGHAELFINTGDWHSFFWRNEHWEEYTGILPAGIGLNLYFADFEGDGDLDVFSQNGVWLSLTPSDADDDHAITPASFSLSAYPNPFNAQTTIAFDLPRAGDVSLRLFDLLGREVEMILQQHMNAGTHTYNYNAADLPSGVYFAQLEAAGFQSTHKLLLLK